MAKDAKYSINIPDSDKPRIVIAGGGFGGLNLIRALDPDKFQIVLIDRYNYHTFQPLLYQVATAGLEPDSIAGPLRKIIGHSKNVYFRMLKAERIEAERNVLITTVGTVRYDYLILCTGSQVNFFNKQDIAVHSFPLKQITHALDLRSHVFQQFEKLVILTDASARAGLLNYVIVGAGPTGVELCGALAELRKNILPHDYPDLDIRRMEIYLVEGLDRVLPGMSEVSGKKAQKYLEKMGVKILLNCLTDSYNGKVANLSNGQAVETETLIWAAGVKGNLIEGFSRESKEKNFLRVNEVSQVYKNHNTGELYPNIFAIGDVALMKDDRYPKGYPGVAQVAIQQGNQLAGNLNRKMYGKPMKPFRYKNKGVMATIGRNKAVADLPGNIRLSGFAGWFIWMSVHLMFLVGFRNKAVVFSNWAWNYFTYDRGMRLIIRPAAREKDPVSTEMKVEMKESV